MFFFSLSLVISRSRSNYPCRFVYDCASLVFSSNRWKIETSWFPTTSHDLENLIYSEVIPPKVYHYLVQVALGVRVLSKMRCNSHYSW